jgi:hypothetical protein
MASRGRELTRRRHAKHCERKTRYETERAARADMRGIVGTGGAQIGSLNVYRCVVCKGYHIGHTPTQRRADPA